MQQFRITRRALGFAMSACLTLCCGFTALHTKAGTAEQPEAATANSRFGATGIGVSDLAASSAFYQAVLGVKELRRYELGYINEIVLGYGHNNEAVLVLMNWPDQDRSYDGNDVKVVFYVDDPMAAMQRLKDQGGTVDRPVSPIEALPGKLVGMGRDPDRYVVELINN